MKKYYLKIYGCAMNISDAQMVAGWYEQNGWQPAEKIQEADEIVIISCSVREAAENRVYGLINNLSKLKIVNCPATTGSRICSDNLKIVLTGCMLRYPIRYLKEMLPAVDQFKKISDFSLGAKFKKQKKDQPALVPIMEGCNNYCSYCVVPYARGKETSRPFSEIVEEVECLTKKGFKEITLLGQNVNSYQNDFAKLLTRLNKIEKIEKISFLTSNPWDLNNKIIRAMKLPKIDRYLHLPVQSGDDEILRKMNRKYKSKDYLTLIKKIKKEIPEIKLGTDIIVGFPGETEAQFQNTVDLCKEVDFVKAYVSMYSPRPQTLAYKIKNDVSMSEKRKRWLVLDSLINQKSSK